MAMMRGEEPPEPAETAAEAADASLDMEALMKELREDREVG